MFEKHRAASASRINGHKMKDLELLGVLNGLNCISEGISVKKLKDTTRYSSMTTDSLSGRINAANHNFDDNIKTKDGRREFVLIYQNIIRDMMDLLYNIHKNAASQKKHIASRYASDRPESENNENISDDILKAFREKQNKNIDIAATFILSQQERIEEISRYYRVLIDSLDELNKLTDDEVANNKASIESNMGEIYKSVTKHIENEGFKNFIHDSVVINILAMRNKNIPELMKKEEFNAQLSKIDNLSKELSNLRNELKEFDKAAADYEGQSEALEEINKSKQQIIDACDRLEKIIDHNKSTFINGLEVAADIATLEQISHNISSIKVDFHNPKHEIEYQSLYYVRPLKIDADAVHKKSGYHAEGTENEPDALIDNFGYIGAIHDRLRAGHDRFFDEVDERMENIAKVISLTQGALNDTIGYLDKYAHNNKHEVKQDVSEDLDRSSQYRFVPKDSHPESSNHAPNDSHNAIDFSHRAPILQPSFDNYAANSTINTSENDAVNALNNDTEAKYAVNAVENNSKRDDGMQLIEELVFDENYEIINKVPQEPVSGSAYMIEPAHSSAGPINKPENNTSESRSEGNKSNTKFADRLRMAAKAGYDASISGTGI